MVARRGRRSAYSRRDTRHICVGRCSVVERVSAHSSRPVQNRTTANCAHLRGGVSLRVTRWRRWRKHCSRNDKSHTTHETTVASATFVGRCLVLMFCLPSDGVILRCCTRLFHPLARRVRARVTNNAFRTFSARARCNGFRVIRCDRRINCALGRARRGVGAVMRQSRCLLPPCCCWKFPSSARVRSPPPAGSPLCC